MIANQIWAHIFEGKVMNRVVMDCRFGQDNYSNADYLAKCVYGPEAFAVDTTQYATSIGDSYRNGIFYHIDEITGEEKEIPYILTEQQEINKLKREQNETILALAEMYNFATENMTTYKTTLSDVCRNVIIRAITIRLKCGEELQSIMDSYTCLSEEDKNSIIEDIKMEL